MNQFWETVIFDNQYAPIKVYDIKSSNKYPNRSTCTLMTQKGDQKESEVFSCRSFIHCHDFLELLYIREDNFKVNINGDIFNASSGDVFFINSYDVHDIEGIKDHWVILIDQTKISHMPKEVVNGLFPYCNEHKWLKSSDTKVNKLHKVCAEMIESLIDTKGLGSARTTGLFYLLLDEVYAYANSVNAVDAYETNEYDNKLIYDILKFLENNYTDEISLDEIAHLAGFSKNYFCRFFKSVTGKTFTSFLNEMRCQRARDLLENTKKPVTQIALDTGFSSISYFSRIFKEYWGVSPRQIRR